MKARAGRRSAAWGLLAAIVLAALAVVAEPSPSPAGAGAYPGGNGRILYVAGAEVRVVDPAGGSSSLLFPAQVDGDYYGVREAVYSPDGSSIAFAATDWNTGVRTLRIAGPDGSDQVIVPGTERVGDSVSWSPDGSRLAFLQAPEFIPGMIQASRLVTIGVDGADRVEVLNPDVVWPREPWETKGGLGSPEWSPDGQQLLLVGGPRLDGELTHRTRLWRVGADGSGLVRVGELERVYRAVWSPDGSQIAVTRRVDTSGLADYVVETMAPDGTGAAVQATQEDTDVRGLAWSPDGTQLAYAANGIRLVDLATGTERVLEGATGSQSLSWEAVPEVCTLPQDPPGETAAAAEPPPPVGNWLFSACWRKTGESRWEATGQVNANGLIVTPGEGGRIVLDTAAQTLTAQGSVRVALPPITIGSRTWPSLVLYEGSLNWSLSAAQFVLPLQEGVKYLGLVVESVQAAVTTGSPAGEVRLGPIQVGLPDLLGGTAEVTIAVRPGGVRPSSWRIGPTERTLGALVPVQNLLLTAGDEGWGVAGDVVIPGSAGSTLGGSVNYTPGGTLSGASVRVGNVSLFGGALPVKNLTFSWDQQRGWGAAATAPVPGQSGSSVGVGLTYNNGAITAGHLNVTNAALGGTALVKLLELNYVALDEQWRGQALVALGGENGATVTGSFAMRSGQFISGQINATGINKALGPGFWLTRLGATYDTDPWRVTGTVGLGAGPLIENKPAVQVTGTGFYRWPSEALPGLWRVDANVELTDFELASAWVERRSTGRIDFGGHLGPAGGFNFAGVTLNADLRGWVDGTRGYSAEGTADLRINGLDVTGRAVVSSTGVAACGGVKSGWTWQTGLAYRWAGDQLNLLAGSCDLSPWTTQAPPPETTTEGTGTPAATFVVPADVPVHAIELAGTTGPPLVTLEGPAGESFPTPTDPADLGVQEDHVVLQDAEAKTTTFLIDTPTAGTWEVHLQPGSSPLAEVATAAGLDDPEVSATVSGTGAARLLEWGLTPRPGQVVTFAEVSPDAAAVITSTSAATGQVEFTPAAGPAGAREIVALVEQDGLPRAEIVLGSYDAPGGLTVTVERSGSGGTVTSSPAGIACGPTCTATFTPGTELTLTAVPDAGGTFEGWSGPCEGTDPCTFTPAESTTVGAAFTAPDNQAPTSPTVTGPTAAFRADTGFTVTWGGATDADGVVQGYDVRSRRAGLNGTFGPQVDWLTATPEAAATFTGVAGSTYCFSARAIDDDGATSPWSAERCTTTPLDDRGLSARGGFVRRTQAGNLAGTLSETTRTGATLTRNGVRARQLAVIVQRGPGCGTVRIRHAGQIVGTINLQAGTVRKKQVVTFTLPAARTGTLQLSVTSTRKPVRIDGIAALP